MSRSVTPLSPWRYALLAPALLALQNLAVALAYVLAGQHLAFDAGFWLLPLRRLSVLPGLEPWAAAVAFASSLAISWLLAMLSYRRAAHSGSGFVLAALTIVPAVQIAAVLLLGLLPVRHEERSARSDGEIEILHLLQGVLAGVTIIVAAVLISALTFGAYGWGLFVMTPFLVGLTTAYLANRSVSLRPSRTVFLVLGAAALGSLALIMLALEGLICILLASPLGAGAAILGGVIGENLAAVGHRRGKPLLSVALLPAVFLLEGAMPPTLPISVEQSIDISAPPSHVWRVLISGGPIREDPGMVARAGLAYPLGSELMGTGVGAERRGVFSTGIARERVTQWLPNRRLAFTVLDQPPVMEEMSPYRRVHAPHVSGYFDTVETRFDLISLPDGGTRLIVHASHVLRIDPVLYWEPIAQWAIQANVTRVLEDLRQKAERPGT